MSQSTAIVPTQILKSKTMDHFTFWISPFAQRNRCNSQASRSNYRGYLHVLKYLLSIIIIILMQKGVMQTYTLADI